MVCFKCLLFVENFKGLIKCNGVFVVVYVCVIFLVFVGICGLNKIIWFVNYF